MCLHEWDAGHETEGRPSPIQSRHRSRAEYLTALLKKEKCKFRPRNPDLAIYAEENKIAGSHWLDPINYNEGTDIQLARTKKKSMYTIWS